MSDRMRLIESDCYVGPVLTPDQRAAAEKWLPFAYKTANKYAERINRGQRFGRVDLEDLQAVALMATVDAALKFDPTRATSLGALLGLMLRQRLHHEVCRQKAAGFGRIHGNLVNGRTLFAEMPARFGLDAPIADGLKVADLMAGPAPAHEADEELDHLRAAVAALPDRHRTVIRQRMAGERLHVIADRMGICKERVRQLEMAAHGMLREAMTAGQVPEPEPRGMAAPPKKVFTLPCSQCGREFPPSDRQRSFWYARRPIFCRKACVRTSYYRRNAAGKMTTLPGAKPNPSPAGALYQGAAR